ncbi:hypothetical protein AAVH_18965 [Aphelenchoides avenae]|nr:hypothetical protein AAVH_18965 [Aphelenchus avenae]
MEAHQPLEFSEGTGSIGHDSDAPTDTHSVRAASPFDTTGPDGAVVSRSSALRDSTPPPYFLLCGDIETCPTTTKINSSTP